MSELDEFVEWCIKCGHYQAPPLVVNFRKYKQSRRERETEALIERSKGRSDE